MNINIRLEEEKDYLRVEEIAREAFWNLYIPGAHEHFVVHSMRMHSDFIKELTFVIEIDNQVEGAIFYTHSKIAGNTELKTITFGPVCISPKFHRKGLGKKLISHSINAAKDMGFKAIITLGYPYHYTPYGFVGAKKFDICMPDGKYYKGLLALELQENALANISGHPEFSSAFEVSQADVDAYDLATFPPKEKLVQASQKEYEIACQALDE